ncbi:hypothetical protein [Exiguobacterium antarcticum]|uniref:hypothetical protein n=1 Tax=Exiguobacterium antarcticum TaxID=132920 RepID=UPI000285EC75|nr:hypothetical protein [Exiguobacterium antarcticum]AFS70384.1 Hypothetical protein Eab7_1251 [Exiguobacterium antarcticum B7]
MKKFRGKRRYFRNLQKEQQLSAYPLDFSPDSWFDFWHVHLDFDGRGNDSRKIRIAHVRALLHLMDEFEMALKSWGQPYQTWIELSRLDAASDAVFVHTNNPNDNNFPHTVPSLSNWGGPLPDYLQSIDLKNYQIHSYEQRDYDEFDEEPEETIDQMLVIQRLDFRFPL